SFRRTLSPGEVPASCGFVAPMAQIAAAIARGCQFLSHTVTPSRRGGGLLVPTRNPLAGTNRAHADRLRAWRLRSGLVDTVRPSAPGFAASRFGHCRGL